MKRYEAMFLFDTAATREWSAIEQEVQRLCDRIGANVLVCVKFDERRLAYEIRRRKRGTYVLTYIEAPSDRIGELERDAQLSELVLRLLVLRADGITDEKIEELKAHPAEVALAPAGDGRRHDDFGLPPDRRRPRGQEVPSRAPSGQEARTGASKAKAESLGATSTAAKPDMPTDEEKASEEPGED